MSGFLTDAARVPGGFSPAVAFPAGEAGVAALLARARTVLPVGAQSSLTGGATPRGEIVLSTRAMNEIGPVRGREVRVGAGVALVELQRQLAQSNLYYPPVPTFEGASVGGAVATNAAGPATFKYGSTRRWVRAVTVVLACGDVLEIARGEAAASEDGFEIERHSGEVLHVPLPAYRMPAVPKLSAGYFAAPGMDLVDLFVGAEGTLGVIVSATLEIVARPRRLVALVHCAGDSQALAVTAALRDEAQRAWRGGGPLDVAAIEYMDARALEIVPDDAFARAGVPRPVGGDALLLVQVETGVDDDASIARFERVLSSCGVAQDPAIALPGDERGAQALFALREAVPAAVNARIAAAQAQRHPGIEKTAGDMIVPFDRLAESMALYRRAFEQRGLAYALWGHASDGNLHPNVIPAAYEDVLRGRDAILEIGRGVIAMGGAPLAEHGVGRSALKQELLRELYGDDGIAQMRRVKRALDPEWKLAPGVLFACPEASTARH